MKKLFASTPIILLMFTFAAIQWFNLYEGGHAFTQTERQLQFWSASHIALMFLTGLCIVGLQCSDCIRQKIGYGFAIAFLAIVQITGAYVGRGSVAAASDVESSALLLKAEAMERQADDIRSSTIPIINGLSTGAASANGKDSRDRVAGERQNLDRAGNLRVQAAELRAKAGVTSASVADGLIDVLLFGMTIAIELGFAICAHLLSRIFCNEFSSVFNNLQIVKKETPPKK